VLAGKNEPTGTEKIGLVIDKRYQITGLLGRGGMGSVYRAEHVRLKRQVALKLLHSDFGRIPELSKRFEREAFATGRIDHPNIVTVSDFGELDDGTLYLVMELLDGQSLADVLEKERKLSPRRALQITRHILRGLGHAHKAGVVHRDIKPENVLLVEHAGDPDFAKLLDFGIAKLVGEAAEADAGDKLTQAGVAFGTPAYISPEQALGETVDHRADLYSVTCMLYELLTGRCPFVADDKMKLLSMHATRTPQPLAALAPELAGNPELETLVQRGLAKRREDRWASAEQYMEAIEAYAAREAGRAVATPLPSPGLPQPVAAVSLDMPAHTTTGFTPTLDPRKKKWITIGVVSAAGLLLLAIIASAAGSGSDSGSSSKPAKDRGDKIDKPDKPDKAAAERDATLARWTAQLDDGKTCADRRAAVAKLEDLGDKRAIPPLEKAKARKGDGDAGNACLIKDAEQALGKLRELP
jgi:serine/threonine protein kinase